MKQYDVIVLGLGGIGSAVFWRLAKAGLSVAGVDRYNPPHEKGSSHGQTRIIRKAIFEGKQYLSLINRSYDLWKELEQQSDRELFVRNPALIIGEKDGSFITNSLKGLPAGTKRYSPQEAQQKFSFLHLRPDEELVVDESAGYLHIEECIEEFLRQADADIFSEQEVVEVSRKDGLWVVRTDTQTLYADHVVFACGPWTSRFVQNVPIRLVQKTLVWTACKQQSPLLLYERSGGKDVYSFPCIDGEVKFARDAGGDEFASMGTRPKESEEIQSTYGMLRQALPFLNDGVSRTKNCVYSMTPDSDFIISTVDGFPQAIVLAGFSGHGYKYAPAIGEVVTQHIVSGEELPETFSIRRFD